jgi:hypothetical protein
LSTTSRQQRNISSTQIERTSDKNNRGGSGNKKKGKKDKGGKKNIARSYSIAEWRAMSPEEQEKVRTARAKAKQQGNKNNSSSGQKRTAAATTTNNNSEGSGEADLDEELVTADNAMQKIRQHNVSSVHRDQDVPTQDAGDYMSTRASRRKVRIVSMVHSFSMQHPGDQNRCIFKAQCFTAEKPPEMPITYERTELDSRADTCCVGASARVIEYTGRHCQVHAFNPRYKPLTKVPIVKAVTAYDTNDGEVLILCMNQALYFGDEMPNTLLNPNQLRSHGVIVDDCPIHLSPDKRSTHSLYFPDEQVRLPLELHGCISYLPTRLPTMDEINRCQWLELTSDTDWDPYSEDFANRESKAQANDLPEPKERLEIFSVTAEELFHSGDQMMASISSVFSEQQVLQHPLFNQPSRLPQSVDVTVDGLSTGKVTSQISSEQLAKKWGIGVKAAEKTLDATTQKFIRSSVHPIERRYRTAHQQLKYKQLGGRHGRFYSDTMFSSVKSVLQNTCGQLWTNDIGFYHFTGMRSKSEAPNSLDEFVQHVGIPSGIVTDDAKELTLGRWKKLRERYSIKCTETEPLSPWQNRAEGGIRELKRHVLRLMRRSQAPKRLWDFCALLVAKLRSLTVNDTYLSHGRTPHEIVTGKTPDISEYTDFEWYQPVWYLDVASFPADKKLIGRWIGVSHRVGQAMCFWILPQSGIPISRSSVQAISADELATTAIRWALNLYDDAIEQVLGDSVPSQDLPVVPLKDLYLLDEDNALDEPDDPFEPEAEKDDADAFTDAAYDSLISAEVYLPHEDQMKTGRVLGFKRDREGSLVGRANPNPLLSSRMYQVEFSDGPARLCCKYYRRCYLYSSG